MWLNEFKVALVQKDIPSLELLISSMPEFDSIEEMKEASFLILEAQNLLESLKSGTQKSLQQIKRNIEFLKSAHSDDSSSFNIKL